MFKIYNVIEGPFPSDEIPDWDDVSGWVVLCLVEQWDGSLKEEEIVFETFSEAYELVSWFKSQIAPYEIVDFD